MTGWSQAGADDDAPSGTCAPAPEAVRLVEQLTRERLTLATAESLTGGLLGAAVTAVPGSSAVFRGGVVAYAPAVKADVLGVDAALLAARGAVNDEVARQMARGAARLLGASCGLATTGVAGPAPSDGQPVGTVFVAAVTPGREAVRRLELTGSRGEIRGATVTAALALLGGLMAGEHADLITPLQ